jgi:hypothetical protein
VQHTWKTASEEISRLWALMEFTPNSCSSKCPRTPIYRLGIRMGVRQNLPGSRTVHFELWFLPYIDKRPDGIPHRLDGWLIFPFLKLWKESVIRSRTDRRPDVLLKRPDGASLHRSFSIGCRCLDGRSTSSGLVILVCLISGRMEQ